MKDQEGMMADVSMDATIDAEALLNPQLDAARYTDHVIEELWDGAFDQAKGAIEILVHNNRYVSRREIGLRFSVIGTRRLHELLEIEKLSGGIQRLRMDQETQRFDLSPYLITGEQEGKA